MRASSVLSGAAALQLAAAYDLTLYWGVGGDGERSLADYCASSEGANIVVLSFLNHFGGGAYPSGGFNSCVINSDGSGDGCDDVANDIKTCQSNGIKVFVSIGGGGSDYSLTSQGDAEGVAYSLWNSWANPDVVDAGTPRPLGDISIDGWDVDLESDNGSQQYLGDLVNKLRGYFSSDSSKTYYISGAPQCPYPDGNMGNSIQSSQYDYLWIQFYNNNCAAADLTNGPGNPQGDGEFNFQQWADGIAGGASSGAKLQVGLAGPQDDVPDYDIVQPSDLPTVLGNSEGVAGFDGFMVFDATAADRLNVDGCNYAQQARSVLDSGEPTSC